MTLPTLLLDTSGNVEVADAQRVSYDSMLNKAIPGTSQPYIVAGTGDPTFTAPKGNLYIKIDATTTTSRLWINTNGATTWTFTGTAGA